MRSRNELAVKLRADLNQAITGGDEYIANVVLELEEDSDSDWRWKSGLLAGGQKPVPVASENRIWGDAKFRVFISHKSEDRREVGALRERLLRFGVAAFVAHEDIEPTQEWQNEIEAALRTADAFVAVLTKGFHESLWTDQEVGFALARGIPIIALRLGRDPYGFIAKFQGLKCDWNTAPIELMKLLIKHERMIGAYISAVAAAASFDHANDLAMLLPGIESLSAEQAKALVDAYNTNSEVRGGFAFNGLKPAYYGKGLVHHLERLGHAGYAYGDSRLIETRTK